MCHGRIVNHVGTDAHVCPASFSSPVCGSRQVRAAASTWSVMIFILGIPAKFLCDSDQKLRHKMEQ